MDGFVEVYSNATRRVRRVPAHFLEDPKLGLQFTKTPRQRALDGELGQRPGNDAGITELREFAEAAEVDITGLRSKADIRAAIDAVVGTEPLPEPGEGEGVAVEPDEPIDVPAGTPSDPPPGGEGNDVPPSEGGQSTPAAGDEGN